LFAFVFFVVYDPSRIILNVFGQTEFYVVRAFNVCDQAEGLAEQFFLVLAVGAPFGAVHNRAFIRQALGKRIERWAGFLARSHLPSHGYYC